MTSQPQPSRFGSWRAAVPVAMLAAGLLFGTSAAVARHGDSVERPTDLVSLVKQRSEQVERLTAQVDELGAEVELLGQRREPTDQSRQQADDMAVPIGAAPVAGPAVQVVLDDAGYTLDTLPEGYTVDDVVVHQQDVQAVVNALWAGGAEAMMVQDQRIIATSAVQCVGNTLYLQGRVYSPPYTITAVGDVEAMQQALTGDPVVTNYRAWADILGLGYEVEEVEEVELPAFSGTVRPRYAQAVTGPPTAPPPDPEPTQGATG
jgi:uncharacterized protein YlxW (UPF0749 family)